jgi:hypothetical protein
MHIYMKLSIANKRQTTDTINQILTQKYSEIFLINNCQCQNEVKNHTVPP